MSPQPAAKPADKPAETSAPAATNGRKDVTPAFFIEQAKQLEKQRYTLQGKIGKNREMLRSYLDLEALTDEEAEFVEVFYPEKEKGSVRSPEEVESTRKVREAARKA